MSDGTRATPSYDLEMETFFELSLQPMVVADAAGKFERLNHAFVDLLGHSVAELTARPFLDFVHPEDRDSTIRAAAQVSAGERVIDFENRYRCHNGSYKWLRWRSVMDMSSKRVYAVVSEVTASKAASRANAARASALAQRVEERSDELRESEARFRLLVDGIRDYSLIMLDPDGFILSWNEGAQRTKGFTAAQILGQSHAVLYPAEAVAAGEPERDLALAGEKGRAEVSGWRLRNDGSRYRANVVINALRDEKGNLRGFAKITRDITREYEATQALARQQELLGTLMENLAEGVVACDAEGRLTFFNKTAREWHGHDVADMKSADWSSAFDLYAEDGVTLLAEDEIPLVRALRGERVRGAEMAIVVRGEEPRFIEASGDRLRDATGNTVGAVVVMHDITNRKEAERVALRTQRMESIGMLAGGIAHDLNNALAPVLMAIEILRQRYPQSDGLLNSIEKSSRRGAEMVKQLLKFGKGAAGTQIPVKPERQIREIAELAQRTFPKRIAVEVDCPPDLSTIEGDPTQFHQVLLNLCVNARDAMPDGGRLSIRSRNLTVTSTTALPDVDLAEGDYVEIQVADTGQGISEENKARILEPFFSTKTNDKGTGLGLATVSNILQLHRGGLRFESKEGEGSTFFIYLPALARANQSQTRAPFDVGAVDGRGKQVLLIDDEASIREVGRSVMESMGFTVLTAVDGGQGFLILQQDGENLDVIISDKDMPEMDGLALLRHTRALAPKAVWILSSGKIDAEEKQALEELGVSAVLEKPFAQDDLVRILRTTLST